MWNGCAKYWRIIKNDSPETKELKVQADRQVGAPKNQTRYRARSHRAAARSPERIKPAITAVSRSV